MVGSVIQDLEQKVSSAGTDLTSPDGAGYLLYRLIGAHGPIVDELNVFNGDHVVVMPNGIVDEILRVLCQDRPPASLMFEGVILQAWLR